jgi:hypothetical protein
MEKISALIDKLQELKNSNAGLQSISYYAQLLQAEVLHVRNLQRERERKEHKQESHVAVIMPSIPLSTTLPEPVTSTTQIPATSGHPAPAADNHAPAATSILTLPLLKTSIPQPGPAPSQETSAEPQQAEEKKPAFITIYGNSEAQQTVRTPVTNGEAKQESNGVRKELKELNQLVAQNTPSLNDRWRQGTSDRGDLFGDVPVKDLRDAIGINDKFQFIQELFRGDTDTYERSVKTINELHSLQEAEYWIERELKIRQGWEDDNHSVRQFYSLVRKRFS